MSTTPLPTQPTSSPTTPLSTQPQPVPSFAPAPQPASRSCFGTLMIVVITVICTLAVEVIGFIALVGYGIHKLAATVQQDMTSTFATSTMSTSTAKDQPLWASDAATLKSLGIDPSQLPAGASVEKLNCLVKAIGPTRLQQFTSGKATPGLSDIMSAKGCL